MGSCRAASTCFKCKELISLTRSHLLEHVETTLHIPTGRVARAVQTIFDYIFEKIEGLLVLRAVHKVLDGDGEELLTMKRSY